MKNSVEGSYIAYLRHKLLALAKTWEFGKCEYMGGKKIVVLKDPPYHMKNDEEKFSLWRFSSKVLKKNLILLIELLRLEVQTI